MKNKIIRYLRNVKHICGNHFELLIEVNNFRSIVINGWWSGCPQKMLLLDGRYSEYLSVCVRLYYIIYNYVLVFSYIL